jgi:hypothetical protein
MPCANLSESSCLQRSARGIVTRSSFCTIAGLKEFSPDGGVRIFCGEFIQDELELA